MTVARIKIRVCETPSAADRRGSPKWAVEDVVSS
jgi:hypothetical protein